MKRRINFAREWAEYHEKPDAGVLKRRTVIFEHAWEAEAAREYVEEGGAVAPHADRYISLDEAVEDYGLTMPEIRRMPMALVGAGYGVEIVVPSGGVNEAMLRDAYGSHLWAGAADKLFAAVHEILGPMAKGGAIRSCDDSVYILHVGPKYLELLLVALGVRVLGHVTEQLMTSVWFDFRPYEPEVQTRNVCHRGAEGCADITLSWWTPKKNRPMIQTLTVHTDGPETIRKATTGTHATLGLAGLLRTALSFYEDPRTELVTRIGDTIVVKEMVSENNSDHPVARVTVNV